MKLNEVVLLNIRKYQSEDCTALAKMFNETVHAISSKDYSSEQLVAWASGTVDILSWDTSFLEHNTLVASSQSKRGILWRN